VTEMVPGAAGQNTARVVQWLFGVPRSTTVLACIGNDSLGRKLAKCFCSALTATGQLIYTNTEYEKVQVFTSRLTCVR